jgi:hypothetical protein
VENKTAGSFSQNSVSFGKSSGKSVLKAAFSSQSKVAFPKTEVLGKPSGIGNSEFNITGPKKHRESVWGPGFLIAAQAF